VSNTNFIHFFVTRVPTNRAEAGIGSTTAHLGGPNDDTPAAERFMLSSATGGCLRRPLQLQRQTETLSDVRTPAWI